MSTFDVLAICSPGSARFTMPSSWSWTLFQWAPHITPTMNRHRQRICSFCSCRSRRLEKSPILGDADARNQRTLGRVFGLTRSQAPACDRDSPGVRVTTVYGKGRRIGQPGRQHPRWNGGGGGPWPGEGARTGVWRAGVHFSPPRRAGPLKRTENDLYAAIIGPATWPNR